MKDKLKGRARSSTFTIQTGGGGCLSKWEIAPGPAACPVKDLLQGRSPGLRHQPTQEILLERSAFGGGPPAQGSVDVIRNIFDLNTGHGAMMTP